MCVIGQVVSWITAAYDSHPVVGAMMLARVSRPASKKILKLLLLLLIKYFNVFIVNNKHASKMIKADFSFVMFAISLPIINWNDNRVKNIYSPNKTPTLMIYIIRTCQLVDPACKSFRPPTK